MNNQLLGVVVGLFLIVTGRSSRSGNDCSSASRTRSYSYDISWGINPPVVLFVTFVVIIISYKHLNEETTL